MTNHRGHSSVWARVDDLLSHYDAEIQISSITGCPWFGWLRLTLTDPEDAPSRSMMFYRAGRASPEDVAVSVLDDAALWVLETGVDPRAVPEWLRNN